MFALSFGANRRISFSCCHCSKIKIPQTKKTTTNKQYKKNTLKCGEGWSTTPPFTTFTLCNQMTALLVQNISFSTHAHTLPQHTCMQTHAQLCQHELNYSLVLLRFRFRKFSTMDEESKLKGLFKKRKSQFLASTSFLHLA